jgi:hypothetical protein
MVLEQHLKTLEKYARVFRRLSNKNKMRTPATAVYSIWFLLRDNKNLIIRQGISGDLGLRKRFFGILGRIYTVLDLRYLPFSPNNHFEDWAKRALSEVEQLFTRCLWR